MRTGSDRSIATANDEATPRTSDLAPRTCDLIFREEAAQIVATLTRFLGPGHLELAEDAVQETLIKALHAWRYKGLPENPRAWLMTVARNQALDALRRERVLRDKLGAVLDTDLARREDELDATLDLLADPSQLRDDQLRMMFTCCHPVLSREARVALTLKTLGGFGVPEIARAFLTREATIAQRLVRAKKTLRERRVEFVVPDARELPERLDSVLDVLYLLFNEGYSAHQGDALVRHELCEEALRLTTLLAGHPAGDVPVVHALLALMLLQASRLPARTDERGDVLLLDEQDRSRWDRRMIVAGLRELARASTGDTVTAYHLQAGIAACHAVAPDYAATDWRQILAGYDDLLRLAPSPVVALNRAVALAMVEGVGAGIAELERIRVMPELASYYLLYCTAGDFYHRAGNRERALDSYRHAQTVVTTDPERRFIARRVAEVMGDG